MLPFVLLRGACRCQRPTLLALSALVLPSMLAAQTVTGVVIEERTREPLSGAFVVLEDSTGERTGGVLTDARGRFSVQAAAPGRYRLVAELIGFASTATGLLELTAGRAIEQVIEVPVQAVDLSGIRVTTEARCQPRPGSGPETFQLWEEARKALQVTSWAEQQGALRMQIREYTRQLSPGGHAVRDASDRARTGYYDRSPYRSRPAEELERLGYVRQAGENQYDYFGPDADVLLSETFMDSHCFRVVEGPDGEPELVGLAFEPIRGQDRPDVEGVLWVDRGTAELRRLDFTYTRLPFASGRVPEAGGRVEFQRLTTGTWIVSRWRIRMPVMAMKQQPAWRSGQPELEVMALNETGAEVQSVSASDGTVLAEAAGATLYGTVHDSVAGEPLSDALVELEGADRTTRTAVDGTYRFTDLPSGTYTVRFRHPFLDLLGIEPEPVRVALDAGQAARVPLAVPSGPAIAEAFCGDRSEAGLSPALLVGVVSDESGTWPLRDAIVRIDPASGAGAARTLTTDSAGVFRTCIEPAAGAPLRVAGFRPGQAAGALVADPAPETGETTVSVVVDAPGVYRTDLSVAVPAATITATWRNVLTGRVVEDRSREPVVGAAVTLADSAGGTVTTAVSDEEGRFQFPHPGVGTRYGLKAERLGYAPVEGAIAFTRRDQLDVELVMAPRAIELDPIVVVERRHDYLADVGYYMRKDRGLGRFVERDAIERYRPTRLTDILRRQPGVTIQGEGMGQDVQFMGMTRAAGFVGNSLLGASGTGGLRCRPSVYLDGALVRPGGDTSAGYVQLNEVVDPELVQAIEVYRRVSEVPPRYGGMEAACGVIAVWTTR